MPQSATAFCSKGPLLALPCFERSFVSLPPEQGPGWFLAGQLEGKMDVKDGACFGK